MGEKDTQLLALLNNYSPKRDISQLQPLLEAGANAHIINGRGHSIFHYLIQRLPKRDLFHIILLNYYEPLAKLGCPVDVKDKTGRTPFQVLLDQGEMNLPLFKFFAAHEANLHTTDTKGNTYLQRLVIEQNYSLAQSVIEQMLAINNKNKVGEDAFTLLIKHAKCNSVPIELIKAFLQMGADPHITDADGNGLLYYVNCNNTSAMDQLIDDYALDCTHLNNQQQSVITARYVENEVNIDFCRLMYRHGSDINEAISYGKTILHLLFEAYHDNLDSAVFRAELTAILEYKPDLSQTDDEGLTAHALLNALGSHSIFLNNLLCQHGSDPLTVNLEGEHLLQTVVAKAEPSLNFTKRVLDHYQKYDVSKQVITEVYENVLAKSYIDLQLCLMLLDFGADPLATDPEGNHILKMLLSLTEIDLDQVDAVLQRYHKYHVPEDELTALYKEIVSKHNFNLDIALLFIKYGVKADTLIDQEGHTLLMRAIQDNKSSEDLQRIFDQNPTVTIQNRLGNEAIHIALDQAPDHINFDIILELLSRNAEPRARDHEGQTLFWIAYQRRQIAPIFESLLEYDIDIETPLIADELTLYPIDVVIQRDRLFGPIIQRMVEKGVNLSHVNQSGDTPMHRLVNFGHADFVRSLDLHPTVLGLKGARNYTVQELLDDKPRLDAEEKRISEISNKFSDYETIDADELSDLQRYAVRHPRAHKLLLKVFMRHKAPRYFRGASQDSEAIKHASALSTQGDLRARYYKHTLLFKQAGGNASKAQERQQHAHWMLVSLFTLYLSKSPLSGQALAGIIRRAQPCESAVPQAFKLFHALRGSDFGTLDEIRDKDRAGFKIACKHFLPIIRSHDAQKMIPDYIIHSMQFILDGTDEVSFEQARIENETVTTVSDSINVPSSPYGDLLHGLDMRSSFSELASDTPNSPPASAPPLTDTDDDKAAPQSMYPTLSLPNSSPCPADEYVRQFNATHRRKRSGSESILDLDRDEKAKPAGPRRRHTMTAHRRR